MPGLRTLEISTMINNLFDKKTAEYEFLSVSEDLPFKKSDVTLGANGVGGTTGDSQAINNILNHLVDNDLYNEQLILNLSANRNMPGAAITGSTSYIIENSQEGQKFVLTSNVDPHVQIVKRIVSDANANVIEIPELKGRRVNFILDESQRYVVGTDIGLFCSEDRLSGWRMVEETDYFRDAFYAHDCRCCIKNYFQGTFHNELDRYQYFLGTNSGVFGLDNSDFYNDFVQWVKIGENDPTVASLNVYSLRLDPDEKNGVSSFSKGVLFIGTDGATGTGIWRTDGTNFYKENGTQFFTNDIEILNSDNLRERDEHILVGTDSGIKQSQSKYFPDGLSVLESFQNGEFVTAIGVIGGELKYIGTNKNLYNSDFNKVYPFNNNSSYIYAIDFLDTGDDNFGTYEFVALSSTTESNGQIHYKNDTVSLPWTSFDKLNNGNNVGVTVLDNKVVVAIQENEDNKQIAYTQWLLGIFGDGGTSNIPENGGDLVSDFGDNELSCFVGTNQGVNIYGFGETVSGRAVFKIQNNIKDVASNKIFMVGGKIISVCDENRKIWISDSNDVDKDYDRHDYPSNATTISDIKYVFGKFLVFSDAGLFITSDFEDFGEVEIESNKKIVSCAEITYNGYSNLLFSTDDGNVYLYQKSDLQTLPIQNDLKPISLLSSTSLHNTNVVNSFDVVDNREVKQYEIVEKDVTTYGLSHDLNYNLSNINSDNSGQLNSLDLSNAILDKEGDFKFIDVIGTDNNLSHFAIDQNISRPNFSKNAYMGSKDINYLTKELLLLSNSNLGIYGLKRDGKIDLSSNNVVERDPDLSNYVRLNTTENFKEYTSLYNDAVDMYCNLFEDGALAIARTSQIDIFKTGYHSKGLDYYKEHNKNYWGDGDTVGHLPPLTSVDIGKHYGLDGKFNFVQNDLSSFSGQILQAETLSDAGIAVYCTTTGVYSTTTVEYAGYQYFNGIVKVGQGTNQINCMIYENDTFYAGTNDFILTSSTDLDGLTGATPTAGMFDNSSCKYLAAVAYNGSVTLIDSLYPGNTADYLVKTPLILGLFTKGGNSGFYAFNTELTKAYDVETGQIVQDGSTMGSSNITSIHQIDDVSVYVVTNNSISAYSNFGFDNNGILSHDEISVGQFVNNLSLVVSFEDGVFVSENNGNISVVNGTDVKDLDISLQSIVVDGKNAYGSNGNDVYLYSGENFRKILEVDSGNSPLKGVHTIATEESDIFDGTLLLVYENGKAYIATIGIDSSNTFVPHISISAQKVAVTTTEDRSTIVVAAKTNNTINFYTVSTNTYESTDPVSVSSKTLPTGTTFKDMCFQKIGDENSLLVMVELSGNVAIKRYVVNKVNEDVTVEDADDPTPGEGEKYLFTSVEMPDDGVTSINSFVTQFEDPTKSVSLENAIIVTTNAGLGYILLEGNGSVHLFEAHHVSDTNMGFSSDPMYTDIGDSIVFASGGTFRKVSKDNLAVASASVSYSGTVNGFLGATENTLYPKTNSGYALSIGNFSWNNGETQNANTISYIEDIKMNSMIASNNIDSCVFGSDSGLYKMQDYTHKNAPISENILSNFNVDCVEFMNDNPIFGMHLICLDLEFDYLSSTIEDLTTETLNRVLAIDKISKDEVAIVDKDSIKIYNVDLSQTIELNLMNLRESFGGVIFDMSPIAVDSNMNLYLAVNGSSIVKLSNIQKNRVFGQCVGKYKFLNSKFKRGTVVNNIYPIDDESFLIGTSPFSYERNPHSVHYIRNLRMDIALGTSNGDTISADSIVIGDVVSDITHGNTTKHLFSAGSKLYGTYNDIFADVEVDKISSDQTIRSLFAENDAMYLIGTDKGLWATTPSFELDDELKKWNVDTVSKLMEDTLSAEIDKHIASHHLGESNESKFLSVLNTKMPVAPTDVPPGFTSSSEPITYDSIMYVSSDIVVDMEFNDSNKYIRGSVKNWITDLYGGESTYSDSGYVDQMVDPIDGRTIDFSEVSYVCKNWNSGMKEILVHVPTTMTYYINNPKGFTNSKYSGVAIPRRNAKGTRTPNTISNKCTHYQLILDNRHFEIKNICMVQIDGNSLPLRMYRDETYCQEGRENLFDSVVEPSEVNSLPVISNEGVNNVEHMDDASGFIRINFSIYGTDAQSIRILAN